MKIRKLAKYNPVVRINGVYLDGTERELRRCGMLPDLFSDRDGNLYRLSRVRPSTLGGHPVIKYRGNSVMVRHLVMDAWHPGWEEEGSLVAPINGNEFETGFDNLEIVDKGRGRPRSNMAMKQLMAVELIQMTQGDIEAVCEELSVPPLFVEKAIKAWAPWLLEDNNRFNSLPVDVETEDD